MGAKTETETPSTSTSKPGPAPSTSRTPLENLRVVTPELNWYQRLLRKTKIHPAEEPAIVNDVFGIGDRNDENVTTSATALDEISFE